MIGVVLFEMRMGITCIDSFSLYLRNKDASVTSRAISPERFAYHALLETKSLQECVGGDRMVIIEMTVLNQFMETTGRAQNIGCLGDGLESMVTFQ
jgi:hypothetical protein